ncbi:MAG TPA: FHA domain-containing protein [Solirubrobacterales bacterium]
MFTSVRSSLGPGTYFCLGCGSQLSLKETDPLPDCPRCGGSAFRRDSIFESRQDHGALTREFSIPPVDVDSNWLREARASLPKPGSYLALNEGDGPVRTFRIEEGWTRIGRSPKADIRLDDPSVSRRHALLVHEAGKPIRVLDDRSLNGVILNGEEIEWGRLADGDELLIGRHRLSVLEG